jgi:hypothetical protein
MEATKMKKRIDETMEEWTERRRQAGWFSKMGKKGGLKSARLAGSEGMSERGLKGGIKLFETRGREFYSHIGSLPKGHGRSKSDE